MTKQIFVPLEQIMLSVYIERGFVYSLFNADELYLGYGPKAKGSIKFFESDFFNKKSNIYIPKYVIKTTKVELLSFLKSHDKNISEILKQNFDEKYLSDFKLIQNWIKNGHIKKMVAVTRETYEISPGFNPISCLYKILLNMPGNTYGYWNKDYGILGSSPEPLFICNESKCFSFALAGTISTNEKNYQQEILNDPKEKIEHNLVIDDLCIKLKKISDNVKVEKTEVLDFGNIAHLKTKINFIDNLKESSIKKIHALSPSAALGGFPAKKVINFFDKTHHYCFMKEHRVFGGVCGIEGEKFSQALVMIRNIQWDNSSLWIESGIGIVESSNEENELAEVIRKRNTVKKVVFS